jgi:Leucine-rich repeat (LRR) protein
MFSVLGHAIGVHQRCQNEPQGLWLHGNLLTSLPPTIAHLTALKQLSLSGNRLAALPDAWAGMTQLEDFAAAGNHLTQVGGGHQHVQLNACYTMVVVRTSVRPWELCMFSSSLKTHVTSRSISARAQHCRYLSRLVTCRA